MTDEFQKKNVGMGEGQQQQKKKKSVIGEVVVRDSVVVE